MESSYGSMALLGEKFLGTNEHPTQLAHLSLRATSSERIFLRRLNPEGGGDQSKILSIPIYAASPTPSLTEAKNAKEKHDHTNERNHNADRIIDRVPTDKQKADRPTGRKDNRANKGTSGRSIRRPNDRARNKRPTSRNADRPRSNE